MVTELLCSITNMYNLHLLHSSRSLHIKRLSNYKSQDILTEFTLLYKKNMKISLLRSQDETHVC